jgi:hypothetical protein
VLETLEGNPSSQQLWVAHVAIEDGEDQPGGALVVGTRQRLRLEPIDEHYDLESTSWVDDTDAGLQIWFATEIEPVD